MRIEDYGLIGNTVTSALVGRDGSIDWLCLPTFDGGACFAALLGGPDNGFWRLAPTGSDFSVTRAYRKHTAILETHFENAHGALTLIDFMPPQGAEHNRVDLVRIVRCDKGRLELHSCLALRFDYGSVIPWVQKSEGGITAIAGPDAIQLRAQIPLYGRDMTTCADFTLSAGESRSFCMTWFPSHFKPPRPIDAADALESTEDWWREWAGRARDHATLSEPVMRSLITLKTMTFSPTGAVIAAPTTSLPERLGGERNWDYRYCWIRDSTFTLYALLMSGFVQEARDWRRWLLRAAAGEPSKLQIMYGLRGERRLTELEISWLAGYENSKPVRIGNQAHVQLQLDVYGELMDTLHVARKFGLEASDEAWPLQKALVSFVASVWDRPDFGIWEVRGPPQHFTYSKAMAWVAVDRAIKAVEDFGLDGPLEEWRGLRAQIHADVCKHGYSASKGCFTQIYGQEQLDASLLLLAQLGFIAPQDPRYIATVAAVERELMADGLVLRYRTDRIDDGLQAGEGAFLACSFWLVDAYVVTNRYDEARKLFERLLTLRNDLGLFAEEYDPVDRRQLGNFPQAFSHIALVNSAHNLASHRQPAQDRSNGHAHLNSPNRSPR